MELNIENVSMKYGKHVALRSIDLSLVPGVYGILGPNGSGKTTMMNILATLLRPTSGYVKWNGQDILKLQDGYRNVVGFLPQQIGLYPEFTANDFLLYLAAIKGITGVQAKRRVEELLEWVGLTDVGSVKLGGFSGGMKQRIGIAQALLNDPDILIVDEPTAGLDPKERIRFRNLLSSVSSKKIVLLSTHIVSDIEYIANEIVVMKKGEVINKGNPQVLLKELEGKVWSAIICEKDLQEHQQNYRTMSVVQKENGIEVRFLSDDEVKFAVKKEAPNLEDLYLYYFD
ncbi:ABC transporter ATP-binding protein [Mechercharimyces sp. CAU 1602]|uniref:ABC transporter ATP-binding protein n=1 Tax=Mechercharimyces sp. CAU 1602 TaxID=2973933 RepID=UPI0021635934|nr:ABC transporter ATP-binding protein [Mechercharimyces sp. CAU 1602]MCS1352592.1 ABC transporter ATP-binding protein [Mechercharimyces sp. CAU 1602]